MKPKLISFKLCPFVQKAVLTLLSKNVDFDIEYIDLMDPPQWFLDISPLGKVPVLQVGDQVLFESSVIVEYLDEVNGPSLHPDDLLLKAQNRSWMEFGNECLANNFNLIMADSEDAYNEQLTQLKNKLGQLENKLSHQPYFNGQDISLVDLSFIPFFQRLLYIEAVTGPILDPQLHPKTRLWADQLLSLDIVAPSTVNEIEPLYQGMMKNRGGHIATLMN